MSTVDASRKFHFLREIASGGFGRVYLAKVAHADGFSRLAAVKVLHPKWTENEEIAQRMRDEARLLGMLRHKNIVDVIDLTRIDGRAAVVMEYLEAVDLKVLISNAKRSGKRLPLKAMLEVFAGVASALDAAYNRPPYAGEKPLRVIHRDIKPSNVMVDQNGLPKVLDFGVARAEFEAREAKTQELSFGSVEYMSPERLFFEPETPASDVYSLGVTLYEAIALEKFGKAKLRVDAHEQFVAERFEDLLELNPLPTEEVEDLLHDLLYDMLAFDESGRPSAADCVTRMRSFSRNLPGAGLDEWAERAIPPLVAKYQAKPPRRREGDSTSLVDRVLSEDTGGLLNDPPKLAPEDAPLPGNAEDPQRWDELKKSTLKSLAGEGLGPASSTWNPEAEPVLQKALGPPAVPAEVVGAQVTGTLTEERNPVAPPRAPPPPDPTSAPAPVSAPAAPVVQRPPPSSTHPASEAPTLRAAPIRDRPEPPAAPPEPAPAAPQRREGVPRTPEAVPTVEPGRVITQPVRTPPQPASQVAHAEAEVEDDTEWEDTEAPVEGSSRGGLLGIAVLFFLALLVVAAGVSVVGVAGVGMLWLNRTVAPEATDLPATGAPEVVPSAPEAGTPSEEPEIPEDPGEVPAEAPTPAPAAAPVAGAVFVSHLDGTKKIQVRCDGGSGSGTDRVTIEGDAIGTCTVTAIGADRKRATAVVDKVKAKEYACFSGESTTCE